MTDVTTPPVVRYRGPIIDAHVHVRPPERMRTFLEVAETYGIRTFMGIADRATLAACHEGMPGRIHGLVRQSYEDIGDTDRFRERTLAELQQCVDQGLVRGCKFWFKPAFNARDGLYWDDPRLDHIFDFMADHRLVALVHIADPDIWFQRDYSDEAVYKSKADNYVQLENRLRSHRGMIVQAAHMGGDPEHLDHLDALLVNHPNLVLDLSATKWVARELSKKPEEAREFILKWADRLLWGSDLVVGRRSGMTAEDYASRYYVHRHLWEGDGWLDSPIADSDADGPVRVAGLDLPEAVLEMIYRTNAERCYGIQAAA